MDFRILGPLEVRDGDRMIPLAGGRQRALLALLVLNANETLSTDRLVDELWGEDAPATAPKVVQNHVSQLRRALAGGRPDEQDGLLVTEGSGYALRIDPDTVDVERFERLLEQGRITLARADAQEASRLLRDALSLWRGPPLAEFTFEPFAQAEIARLEDRRLVGVEERIEADLALGRHADLVGELEVLIGEHPLRERLRGQLMLCLYRSGRQAEALGAYQAIRAALVEELGIEPGRELRELQQAILRQDAALDLATAAAAETPRGAFVGRETELEELVAGLDDAFAGRGRMFLLSGEPGIGKSRTAEELAARARARGARVLVGRCWEAGGAPAYWPWVQSIRAYVRASDPAVLLSQLGTGAAEVAQIVPDLRRLFPDLPEPPFPESEGARFRLFDSTAEFLRSASEQQPLVLVLDDLHAADAPSLLLLQFVARQLGSMRLLAIGAYRDVDPIPGRSLTGMLADLAGEPVTRRLPLGGLGEQDVGRYVELTASELSSPQLVAALHEETEGNPLFVGETVRLLVLEGVEQESGRTDIAIPQTVRDVIARRLAHLPDECNRLLVTASVLGREFAVDALARLAGVAEEGLLDLLDQAIAARVVSDVPGAAGRLRFAHVLIRDTLYDGLTSVRRVRMHRQAVEALGALYRDDPGPHLAELAHHAFAGREFDAAVGYAQRAGDRALALFAYEESARLYETGVEALALAAPDEAKRCELLLGRGQAEARAGNTPAAQEAFVEAAGIARRLGLRRELALAAVGYGGTHTWGRAGADTRLVPLLEEGIAGLGEEDVVLRARLLGRLAGALRDEHSRERRDRVSEEALALARRTGDAAALMYALDGRSAAIIAPDTIAECRALADEFREVARRSGDVERLAYALDHRRTVLVMVGDLRGVGLDLAEELSIAERLGQPGQLWQVHAAQAMLALASGELDVAERLIPEAFAFGERSLPATAIPVYRLQEYGLADLTGRLDGVVPRLRELVRDFPARVAFRCALAHACARAGQPADSRRALMELGSDRFSAVPFDQEWLWGMSLLADTAVLLDERRSAPILYELLAPWSALNAADHPEGMRGSVARSLGVLATQMNRLDEAAQHFEAALEMNERMGARPWLAQTRNDYGRMLLGRAGPGDRERGEQLRVSAKELAASLRMSGLAD